MGTIGLPVREGVLGIMLVFISIALGGFGILMITLLLGGDHDVEVDHDISLDVDGDADHDVGGGHHWLSLKVWAAFATAFGAGGSIAKSLGFSTLWSVGIALGFGLVVGFAADAIIVFFYKQQTSSGYSIQDLVGKTGFVILGITPGNYGEVQVRIGSTLICRRAKADDDKEEIKQGQQVTVLAADSSSLLVRKA